MNRWLSQELAAHKDSTLVGFWPLLDGLQDYSGQGHHGLLKDGLGVDSNLPASSRVCGKKSFHCSSAVYDADYSGNSLRHFLECKSTDENEKLAFSTDSKFTISFWVCKNTANGGIPGGIISKGVSSLDVNDSKGWFFEEWSNNFQFLFLNGVGDGLAVGSNMDYTWQNYSDSTDTITPEYRVTADTNLSLGRYLQWNHVALVYDADVTANVATKNRTQMFLNGKPIHTDIWKHVKVDDPNADEIQTIRRTDGLSGGLITYTFNGESTSALAGNHSAATLQTALIGLATPVPGDIVCVSGPLPSLITVTFLQNYHGVNVPQITYTSVGTNEVQVVSLLGATGGTWTIGYGGTYTGSLAYNISSANLQTAIRALSTIGGANVDVTGSDGGPFTITAVGSLVESDMSMFALNTSGLTGIPTVSVVETIAGSSGSSTSSGPRLAGTGADNTIFGTASPWVNPSNVTAADGVNTTCTISASTSTVQSGLLQGSNFGFGIPSGATVLGVEAFVKVSVSISPQSGDVSTLIDFLLPDTSTSSNRANSTGWTTTSTEIIYGSSTDLWGVSWTPSIINNAILTLRLRCNIVGYSGSDKSANVDYMKVKVYYNDPSIGVNEVQTLSMSGVATAGSFTLTYDGETTGGIAYNTDAATTQSALRALSNIGSTGVTCANGSLPNTPITITFGGPLASTDVPLITVSNAGLQPSVTETTKGGPAPVLDIQTSYGTGSYPTGDINYGPLRIGASPKTEADVNLNYSPYFAIPSDNVRLVRIYNRALFSREIGSIFQRESRLESNRAVARTAFVETLGLDLYIKGFSGETGSITLFANGSLYDSYVKYTTLYEQGYDAYNNNATLFVRGFTGNPARDYPTSQLGIYRSEFGNIVLGMNGDESPINRRMTLFVRGITSSGNFFSGYDPEFPLYESGYDVATLSTTLFVGETPNRHMPLFLKGEDPLTTSSHLNCFVRGSTNDGMAGGIDLFTYSDSDGNKLTKGMNLFLQGVNSSSDARGMNLYVLGAASTASNSIELFVMNTQTGVNGSVTLFVQGEGTTDGASPAYSTMNLFLKRDPANAITLYTAGPGEPSVASLDLFIEGCGVQTGNVTLSIPNVLGYSYSPVKLYTHGF